MELGGGFRSERLEGASESDAQSRPALLLATAAHRKVRPAGRFPARTGQRVSDPATVPAVRVADRADSDHGGAGPLRIFGTRRGCALHLPGREIELRAALRSR